MEDICNMTDENTVFDTAFEYQMNGMSPEAAAETATGTDAKLDRIEELETALRGLQASARSKPHHAGETPREYHMHAAICTALLALKETP
jgi:hypothetical protein